MNDDERARLAAERLDRLEESQAFSERRADLLSEQMVALDKALRAMGERVRRLEEGMGRLAAGAESTGVTPGEIPPSSPSALEGP